jgi:hypothetical protein
MKILKHVLALAVFCSSFDSLISQVNSQPAIDSLNTADTTLKYVVVELVNNTSITGKKVSDDGREIGIMTVDKGLILIPKYQIRTITVSATMPTVGGKRVFPNPHPSRYFYSPSGIPLKKGEGYIQAIYFLAYQGQYALTDHFSIGITSTFWASPFLVNMKYTNTLHKSADGKKNIYLATGIQAGSLTYIDPGTYLGIGYAGLTFGNAESNITINGGVLGESYIGYSYYYDQSTGRYTYDRGRENDFLPAISLCWNQRVNSNLSFMGEVWLLGNTIVGGPGMRFYSGRKNTIDFAILGGADLTGGDGIFGIPFISWTRKMGK